MGYVILELRCLGWSSKLNCVTIAAAAKPREIHSAMCHGLDPVTMQKPKPNPRLWAGEVLIVLRYRLSSIETLQRPKRVSFLFAIDQDALIALQNVCRPIIAK